MTWSARLLAIVLASLPSAPALASSSLLHCTLSDVAGLANDGRLEADEYRGIAKLSWGDFTVDLATGAIRRGDFLVVWKVIQEGSTANDTILTPDSSSWPDRALLNAATDFLRVREWPDHPKPVFLAFDLSWVATGTCERL
jgi:hypothetical protein